MAIKNKLSRSFDWHNATQFLGALNDNVFQGLMIFFLIGILGTDKKADINAMAAIIFVVPFLLFTPFAGNLADWFSKRQIIVMAKAVELGVMVLGCVIFYFKFTMGIYAALFLMCTQSAFFGPCKYGIIPELVHKDQISRANSFMEGMTYLAIVIGAALGPFLAKVTGRNFEVAGLFCIAFATVGLFTSIRIEKTKPIGEKSKISMFFVRDVWATLRRIRHDRDLISVVLASAYFMLIGGFAK
ncbi:MAG: MFS transporter, partial [Planctomycetota bacterium]